MAKPPSSMALNPARAPESLPMGVRAPATMTDPGMARPPSLAPVRLPVGTPSYGPTIVGGHERDPRAPSSPVRRPTSWPPCPCPRPTGRPSCAATRPTMFEGVDSADKDPRKSLHVERGAAARAGPRRGLRGGDGLLHQLQHGVDVDLRAAAHLRVPRPAGQGERLGRPPRPRLPRGRLRRLGRGAAHRLGGAQLEGRATRSPSTATTSTTRTPRAHDDSMLAANQRIWGFESNFGGLADIAVVKANQLMPKPAHLSWEEAAVNALCNSTAYRMLVSHNGAPMTQGDRVLVWGASGGLGSFAVQYVLNGGGTPVGVVSSPEKVDLLHDLGVEAVIDRRAAGYRFWADEHTQDESEWRRFGKDIRGLVGRRPRHRLRAPRPPDHGGLGLRLQAGRHHRHLRRHLGLHDRVRQPPPVDEAEDHQGVALRQLPRGLGRQPAGLRGQDPAAALGRLPAGPRWARPPTRCTTTCTRARSGCSAWPPPRGWGSTTPSCGPQVGEDRITLFRRHGA